MNDSVSFGWKYWGYAQLTQAKGLGMWLLRERQVGWKHVPALTKRFHDFINDPMVALQYAKTSDRHPCEGGSPADELVGCADAAVAS